MLSNLIFLSKGRFASRQMRVVIPFVVVFIFSYTALSAENAYYAQLKSVASLDELAAEKKRLNEYSVPVIVEEFKKKGKTFYRIRTGIFSDSMSAIQVSTVLGYQDPWVVKAGTISSNSKRIEVRSIDTITASKRVPFIYTAENGKFYSIYIKKYGFEASVEPSEMIVHFSGRKDRLAIKEVTGFKETDSSLIFGKPHYLVSDPEGKLKIDDNARKVVEKYRGKIPGIDSTFSLFKDCSEKRLNICMECNYKTGMITDKAVKGFDYVEEDGTAKLWQGCLEGKKLGNAGMNQVATAGTSVHSCGMGIVACSAVSNDEYFIVVNYLVKDK